MRWEGEEVRWEDDVRREGENMNQRSPLTLRSDL